MSRVAIFLVLSFWAAWLASSESGAAWTMSTFAVVAFFTAAVVTYLHEVAKPRRDR